MLRLLALLLIGLQAFMPPGMCVCQFVPCAAAEASGPGIPNPQPTADRADAVSGSDDGGIRTCSRCRKAKAAEQPDDRTSPDGSGTLILTSDQDVPVEHLPGCPLVTGGNSARQMVQSPTHLSLGLLLAPLFTQLFFHQPTEKPVFGPVPDVTGPALPIYLAQRTLLI